MTLFVFSSNRALSEFYKNSDDILLPYAKTIKEFFDDIIIVPHKAKLPKYLRSVFLWLCVENINIENLGFDKAFLRFLENSSFIFQFFDEIHSSCVNIDDINLSDTYGDYYDHLRILKEVYEKYITLLDSENLYDIIIEYKLHSAYLLSYKRVHIFIDGVLSKFDYEILLRASKFVDIDIEFCYDRYNAFIYSNIINERLEYNNKYIYNINTQVIKSKTNLTHKNNVIFTYSFSTRLAQSYLVIAKINEWLERGESNIAVIVPDDEFTKYLQLFDTYRNLNYAMGLPNTKLIVELKTLLQKLKNIEEHNTNNQFECVQINHLESKLHNIRLLLADIDTNGILDEVLFTLESISQIIEKLQYSDILEFIISNVENCDDNMGGKVKVMGVLESRGVEFDKLIIVDFNDDFVPMLNNNDMFLNTNIRKQVKMPTLSDKENLQRHYYYHAITSSKEVHISYNAKRPHSSLLDFLHVQKHFNGDELWSFFGREVQKNFIDEDFIGANTKEILSASSIKIFLECKRRFYFHYICKLGISDDSEDENNGSIIHKFLERFGKEFDYSLWDDLVNEGNYSPKKKLDLKIIYHKLQPFLQTQTKELRSGTQILELESTREFIFKGFRFICHIDRVDRVGDEIHVIDYKLNKNFKIKDEDYDYMQLYIYYLALREAFVGYKIRCFYYDLYNNKKFEMSDEVALKCEEIICEAVEQLRNNNIDFSKTENYKVCSYCKYTMLCNRL